MSVMNEEVGAARDEEVGAGMGEVGDGLSDDAAYGVAHDGVLHGVYVADGAQLACKVLGGCVGVYEARYGRHQRRVGYRVEGLGQLGVGQGAYVVEHCQCVNVLLCQCFARRSMNLMGLRLLAGKLMRCISSTGITSTSGATRMRERKESLSSLTTVSV